MKNFLLTLVALLALASASTAHAKGGVLTRVTISGPGIEGTVEITDPEILKALEFENLLEDWGNIGTPHVGTGFELTLYFQGGEGGPRSERLRYYPMPSARPGYIYLVGYDQESSPTSYRWFYAAAEGEATLQRLLKQAGAKLPTAAASEVATWDVISPDALPTPINAHEDVILGFTIFPNADMLRVPNELVVYARLRGSDSATVFFAQADSKPNHYTVKLQFPGAGQWYWVVGSSSDIGQQLMPVLTVVDSEASNQPPNNSTASSEPGSTLATSSAAPSNGDTSSLAFALVAGLIGVIGMGGGFYFWRTRGHGASAR